MQHTFRCPRCFPSHSITSTRHSVIQTINQLFTQIKKTLQSFLIKHLSTRETRSIKIYVERLREMFTLTKEAQRSGSCVIELCAKSERTSKRKRHVYQCAVYSRPKALWPCKWKPQFTMLFPLLIQPDNCLSTQKWRSSFNMKAICLRLTKELFLANIKFTACFPCV